jgi:hypothetical protein
MAHMDGLDSRRFRASAVNLHVLASRLARDFGARSGVTRVAVRAFCRQLEMPMRPEVEALWQEWELKLGKTAGGDAAGRRAKLKPLAARYGTGGELERPEATLLALQTWYLLVVKLLVAEALGTAAGAPGLAAGLCRAAGEGRLRAELEALEGGQLLGQLRLAREGDSPIFADTKIGTVPLGGPSGGGEGFAWYLHAWSAEIERAVGGLAAQLAGYPRELIARIPATGHDLFESLYQQLFPRALRHALGEYYTPDWLARHVLDQVGYQGDGQGRLLDPACGSGTFLVAAIRRLRAVEENTGSEGDDRSRPMPSPPAPLPKGEGRTSRSPGFCRQILDRVVGLDLNPLAVATARANYLLAIADLLPGAAGLEIPVYLCDSILDGPEASGHPQRPFDYVVGNPPWVAWDNLPDDYRAATKPLWQRYGLFSLSANEARHGGGKKDLSMLMLYAAADRYLKRGGRLGMVVTQTLFQSKGAGDGFRRFRLGPGGDGLRVLRVDDMAALNPFPGAANRTSTIVLEKGAATEYPLPYVKWTPGRVRGRARQTCCTARPIEPDQPGSPWFLAAPGAAGGAGPAVGPSDYTAHLGANSGGANGVYWLALAGGNAQGISVRNLAAQGKRAVPAVEQTIEPDLVYPLLRWGDVRRWSARPSAHILLAQDVRTRSGIEQAVMRRDYPLTYAYLRQFEELLTRRAAYRRYQGQKPFWSMYNVGSYTVAPVKVVWRRMDRQLSAAVVETIDDKLLGRRPVVPQETCVLIDCTSSDEAHYLCAMLNSARLGALVAAHSMSGGKGFGTPGILGVINLRRFAPGDSRHAALAAASRRAHELAARASRLPNDAGLPPAPRLATIECDIDRLAGE